MKKKNVKKLRLSRETVRLLGEKNLRPVVGGVTEIFCQDIVPSIVGGCHSPTDACC